MRLWERIREPLGEYSWGLARLWERICDFGRGFARIHKTLEEYSQGFVRLWERIHEDS